MRIAIFESDQVQISHLIVALREKLSRPWLNALRTEADFRRFMNQPEFDDCNLFILDLNCPWSRPGDDVSNIPEEVIMDGAYNAGFRAHKLIRERRPDVPIIFWSTLVGYPNLDFSPYLEDKNTLAVAKGEGQLIPAVMSLLGTKQ